MRSADLERERDFDRERDLLRLDIRRRRTASDSDLEIGSWLLLLLGVVTASFLGSSTGSFVRRPLLLGRLPVVVWLRGGVASRGTIAGTVGLLAGTVR